MTINWLAEVQVIFHLHRKKGAFAPLLSFAVQALSVNRSVFFACGLNVVRGERTRPVWKRSRSTTRSRCVLATAAGRTAGVAFHAGPIADQRVVTAIATWITLISLHACL